MSYLDDLLSDHLQDLVDYEEDYENYSTTEDCTNSEDFYEINHRNNISSF